jgi:F-type H+-transporting ATPase subunit gamma
VFDQPDIAEEDAVSKFHKLLYVPITTNRGSCGALNSNMAKYLQEIQSPKMRILGIGKKSLDSYPKILTQYYSRSVINDMKQAMSMMWASYVVEHMKTFDWDRVQIIYNRYHQASVQKLAVFNIPSFELWRTRLQEESVGDGKADHGNDMLQNLPMQTALMEKDDVLLEDFYDFHLALSVLNASSENELSEYASRIVAVENQLNNITGLMNTAGYTYNKTRKELITAELLEIIGTMTAMTAGGSKGLKKGEFWAQ